MLINTNYKFKVKDINYDQYTQRCACILEYYDMNNNLIKSEKKMWKGSDFFLNSENLEETSALSLIYKNLCPTIENCVWLYSKDEAILNDMPKIYKYVKAGAKLKHFHDINYKTELSISIHPKRTFVRGELQKVVWYSGGNCTDPILEVTIAYNRNALGFVVNRTTTRSWYNIDDSLNSETKVTYKNYTINLLDQIDEGITRRGNIIKGLQMPILGMMVGTITNMSQPEIIQLGRDFLKDHKENFQSFIDESHKQIITDITSANDFWLDNIIDAQGTNIRMFVLNELNI